MVDEAMNYFIHEEKEQGGSTGNAKGRLLPLQRRPPRLRTLT